MVPSFCLTFRHFFYNFYVFLNQNIFFRSGTGILLAVTIIYQYFEIFVKEQSESEAFYCPNWWTSAPWSSSSASSSSTSVSTCRSGQQKGGHAHPGVSTRTCSASCPRWPAGTWTPWTGVKNISRLFFKLPYYVIIYCNQGFILKLSDILAVWGSAEVAQVPGRSRPGGWFDI